jgi:hypothetical protein
LNEERFNLVAELVLTRVEQIDPALGPERVLLALRDAATTGRALGLVKDALEDGPGALFTGAPPTVGLLVRALRAQGSVIPEPCCRRCGRSHPKLIASLDGGGVCPPCRMHELAVACSVCGAVKRVYGRSKSGAPLCPACAPRVPRLCSRCGRIKVIARRAHDGNGELCDSCFKGPLATCGVCGQHRPCNFAAARHPICLACAPRKTSRCAHCGEHRPASVRLTEGPVCEPCYRQALKRRGICSDCDEPRRLVDPPGPGARRCATCAGVDGLATCATCGAEDRPYSGGLCVRCVLEMRARALVGTPGGRFEPLYRAIVSAPNPYSVHNWLRSSGPAAILAELISGELPLTHDSLDSHPRRRSADYLRHLLVSSELLPTRDDALVSLEKWVIRRLETVVCPHRRRMLRSYVTWRVLRRTRERAERNKRPRTPTAHAKACLNAAISFLEFLDRRERDLLECTQADVEEWLNDGPPSARDVGDFLDWASTKKMTPRFELSRPAPLNGPKTDDDTRFAIARRLLSDETIDLADRVGGCLVLLYGQQLTRITGLRRDQVTAADDGTLRLSIGTSYIEVPPPLDGLIGRLLDEHRHHTAFAIPAIASPWLFAGLHSGLPFSAAHLGQRLRRLGIEPQAARRSALSHLASTMPAAVLARVLNLTPETAVRWVRDAGGDWNRYAAELLHSDREMG